MTYQRREADILVCKVGAEVAWLLTAIGVTAEEVVRKVGTTWVGVVGTAATIAGTEVTAEGVPGTCGASMLSVAEFAEDRLSVSSVPESTASSAATATSKISVLS